MMKKKKAIALVLAAVMLAGGLPLFAAARQAAPDTAEVNALQREIEQYNYVIGANDFSPGYQFTDKEPVMEVADQILAWGSNMVKFSAGSDPAMIDRVLEGRDFDYVFVWFRSNGGFRDGYSEEEARADYDAFYALTQHLLQTYDNTGKEFYLGHWEGDWYYLDGYDASQETVDDTVTRGMIDWLNNRQKAVDDAKRDTPHGDVSVWHYLELNRPVDAMNKGYDRVVNRVLPHTCVDYVSYSAYDSKNASSRTVKKVIDYIYENLPEKSGVPGPRVFIGEIAEPAAGYDFDDAKHCDGNLKLMVKYLRCDVKFCLYWEMYCNETLEDGRSKGFWLIDADGNETRLYKTLRDLFDDGKAYVAKFAKENGRVPTNEEYRQFLLRRPVFVKARISVFFEDIWDLFRSLFQTLGTAGR